MWSLKKNWIMVSNMTWGIWWIMFEPKMCRGIMCHNTEEWCKTWGETELCFEKWLGKFGEFSPSTGK